MTYHFIDSTQYRYKEPRHPSFAASPFIAISIFGLIAILSFYASMIRGSLINEVNSDYRLTEFEHILGSTELKEELQGKEWNYTIIAPTDQAFDKAQWEYDKLYPGEANVADISDIAPIARHAAISPYDYVIASPVFPTDIMSGEQVHYPSMSGQDFTFTRVGHPNKSQLRINGHAVNTVKMADNGVIYLVDELFASPDMQDEARRYTMIPQY